MLELVICSNSVFHDVEIRSDHHVIGVCFQRAKIGDLFKIGLFRDELGHRILHLLHLVKVVEILVILDLAESVRDALVLKKDVDSHCRMAQERFHLFEIFFFDDRQSRLLALPLLFDAEGFPSADQEQRLQEFDGVRHGSFLRKRVSMDEDGNMAKSKSRGKKRTAQNRDQELIVIDEQAGLIFESEKELSAYFQSYIDTLEVEYQEQRSEDDYSDEEQLVLEEFLEPTLDEPDEVWRDDSTFRDLVTHLFIREFADFSYVVVAYLSSDDDEPTFVLTYFPTKSPDLVESYRRGELIYDQKYERVQTAAVDGDALSEGDPLAMGLYISMLKVRSEKDIHENDFQKFADQREETIESPDEIWRKTDMDGNILVSFIREVPDHLVKELTYVAVAQEESEGGVHSLLFSFPSTDRTLVDRYRQGENLQAEEVVQENSH